MPPSVTAIRRSEASKFSQLWNEIINSFREEDLISYKIIGVIIKGVESNISKRTFLANFIMKPLPDLCKKFVEPVEILKDVEPSEKDSVVLLLQDMLEVVTRDMMRIGRTCSQQQGYRKTTFCQYHVPSQKYSSMGRADSTSLSSRNCKRIWTCQQTFKHARG